MDFDGMFEAMVLMGLNPNDWEINYEGDDGGTLALAIPGIRVGMSFQGNDPQPFIDDGWFVQAMNLQDMPQFFRVWETLKEFQAQVKTRKSANEMVKSGSSQENALLAGIIRAGLPEPNRNFVVRRENGKELTVPDFAWEDVKLAFFVDGLWWHVGKDNRERRQAIENGDADVIDAADKMSVSRRERDTDNRSELQVMGWRVLECTDKDLESASGVQKQVRRISKMLRQLRKESNATETVAVSDKDEEATQDNLSRDISAEVESNRPNDDADSDDIPVVRNARPRPRRKESPNEADKAPGRASDGQKNPPEPVGGSGGSEGAQEATSDLSLFEMFADS
jgi:G:T-mismatch repair DNA endonuclease (very short patch repair protein)